MDVPYDATRESLFFPGNADDFFRWGPVKDEAALCAEMSRLAYVVRRDRLQAYLGRVGFGLEMTVGYDRPGTQAFVAHNPTTNVTIVAFRGTEAKDPTDLFDDAKFLKTEWTDGEGRFLGHVHQGFAWALERDEVMERVTTRVNSLALSGRVLLTGHSLGAALATLLATRVKASCLYTFGSCRVGDDAFSRACRTKHIRFVNCCDLVTRVPPEGLDYAHTGLLRYIDRSGNVVDSPPEEEIRADRSDAQTAYLFEHAFLEGTVFSRDLADHSPVNYVSAIMGVRAA
jgi:hypothetical protein